MNKLIGPILFILFFLAPGYKGYGQQPVRMPVRRYVPVPVQRPAGQRYNNQPNQRLNNQRYYGQPIRPLNRPNPDRRMQLVKEGFISRQLRLTPDESRGFWPVYRRYIQDQTVVRILKMQNLANNSPNGTETIDNELKYETELVNIRKHYRDEFLRILPPQKVSELYKSERQFNDEVVRQLSERSVRAGD